MQVGLDFTLFIQIAQFLAIVFIVNFMIVGPIRKALDKRNDKLKNFKDETTSSLKSIEEKKLAYEAQLQKIRSEISDYHNQLKSDATTRTQSMLEKVKAEVHAETAKARAEIENEMQVAKKELESEISALTQEIVATVTK